MILVEVNQVHLRKRGRCTPIWTTTEVLVLTHDVFGFHLSLEIDGDACLPLFNLQALVTADKALGESAAHWRHSSRLFGGKVLGDFDAQHSSLFTLCSLFIYDAHRRLAIHCNAL